jgi:V/A-type H+-transporting ATPase subunit E
MEVRLENLIEKIKSEGVDKANKQADEIVAKAKAQSAEIVAAAKKEADLVKADAKKEADAFRKQGEHAIAQAARDAILALKVKIGGLFDTALKNQVGQALDVDFLKDFIVKIADAYAKGQAVAVTVSPADSAKLTAMMATEITKQSFEIKTDNRIVHGFRVTVKGSDVSYDLTSESIADAMKVYVSARLAELVKG